MASLLLLVLLLLAATIWFAASVVLHAHGQMKRPAPKAGEGHRASVFGAEEITPHPPSIPETSPLLFGAAIQTIESGPPLEFARDLYADPIDGVPFTAGEPVVPCECGIAYRVDSLDWLYSNLGGHCVQCGSIVVHRESYALP